MATRNPSRPNEEIWECTVPGRVSLTVTNERGGTRLATVKGKGQILRISTIDREMAEEVIRETPNNPFRNGMLVRVDNRKGDHNPSTDELSDDDLREIFGLDNDDFGALLPQLSEVNVRRLKEMAKTEDVRHAQVEMLDEHIEKAYSVGGAMPSYEEMTASS